MPVHGWCNHLRHIQRRNLREEMDHVIRRPNPDSPHL